MIWMLSKPLEIEPVYFSAIFATETKPAPGFFTRVDFQEFRQLTSSKSHKYAFLYAGFTKLAKGVHRADEALRRDIDITLAQMILEHGVEVHSQAGGDFAGLFVRSHAKYHLPDGFPFAVNLRSCRFPHDLHALDDEM